MLGLPEAERYAAELSSYQCSSVTTSPDVVVLTALFPEHLDWHGSEEQYYADKLNLIAHGPRRVLANGEDPRLVAALERFHPDAEIFGNLKLKPAPMCKRGALQLTFPVAR